MRRLLLLLLSVVASCRACSDDAPLARQDSGSVVLESNDGGAPVDVDAFRARARVPAIGWALVTRDVESFGAVGTADVETFESADASTAFEAASIAKTIIATCVMQLVERSQLSLDIDVSSYVGFPVRHPDAATHITLRHLLTHTSSLLDRQDVHAAGDVALADFLRGYFVDAGRKEAFFDAPPGSTTLYSNVGPSLAALAVERVAQRTFADFAKTHVFTPLGMRSTAFGHEGLPPSTRIAAPHAARDAGHEKLAPPSHALYPVVDLFTTPRDLARFARAILRGGSLDGTRILSEKSVEEMLRIPMPDAAPDYALGWQVRTFDGRRVYGHEGEDRGASTGLYLDVDGGVGALMLANGDAFQSEDESRAAALDALLRRLLSSARDATR